MVIKVKPSRLTFNQVIFLKNICILLLHESIVVSCARNFWIIAKITSVTPGIPYHTAIQKKNLLNDFFVNSDWCFFKKL